ELSPRGGGVRRGRVRRRELQADPRQPGRGAPHEDLRRRRPVAVSGGRLSADGTVSRAPTGLCPSVHAVSASDTEPALLPCPDQRFPSSILAGGPLTAASRLASNLRIPARPRRDP